MYISAGYYPTDLLLLENTSMTLTEAENLKKTNPEKYFRFVLYIQERLKMEKTEIEKLKNKVSGIMGGGSGESETYTILERIPDDIPEDHVSEIGEMK